MLYLFLRWNCGLLIGVRDIQECFGIEESLECFPDPVALFRYRNTVNEVLSISFHRLLRCCTPLSAFVVAIHVGTLGIRYLE
uniref:Putative secreted peptide n=1 Tax=Anopheles braziliensis TaxID=58242 RepID=A0A2M3ZTC2_9DIPT